MTFPLDDLFLGLDCSTQALKASLLSSTLDVISELAVNFDADLPSYGTAGGVLHGDEGTGEVYSPVMLIVEAIDLLFERIQKAGWDVARIRGIAAAGQVSLLHYVIHELISATRFGLLVQTILFHSRFSRSYTTTRRTIRKGILSQNCAQLARFIHICRVPSPRSCFRRSR